MSPTDPSSFRAQAEPTGASDTIGCGPEAAWSLLADSGDGTRVFSIRAALVPMALLLTEKDGDIIVLDVRIPTQR